MKYTEHNWLFKDTEDTNLCRSVQEEKIMYTEVEEC